VKKIIQCQQIPHIPLFQICHYITNDPTPSISRSWPPFWATISCWKLVCSKTYDNKECIFSSTLKEPTRHISLSDWTQKYLKFPNYIFQSSDPFINIDIVKLLNVYYLSQFIIKMSGLSCIFASTTNYFHIQL